eukprot:279134_1
MAYSTDSSHHQNVKTIIVLILASISALVIIPTTLFIIYHYCKNKSHLKGKAAMFTTGFCYFLFTLLFCINYCFKLYGHIFVPNVESEHILSVTTYFFYGSHFILLIFLLFGRIFYIFHDTEYHLSNKIICCFVIMCVFEMGNAASFMAIMIFSDSADGSVFIAKLIGTMTIIIVIFWITYLYIYKLFQVITHNIGSKNDVLIKSITKYTVLAIVWISTSICFWSIPFYLDWLHSDWYYIIYHTFMLLDVSCNDIAFILGYGFADKVYFKLCNCGHKLIKKIFVILVQKDNDKRSKTFKNIYLQKMEQRKKQKRESQLQATQLAYMKTINMKKINSSESNDVRILNGERQTDKQMENDTKLLTAFVLNDKQVENDEKPLTPQTPLVKNDYVAKIHLSVLDEHEVQDKQSDMNKKTTRLSVIHDTDTD